VVDGSGQAHTVHELCGLGVFELDDRLPLGVQARKLVFDRFGDELWKAKWNTEQLETVFCGPLCTKTVEICKGPLSA
jgi:hypothetical protein